MKNYVAIAVVLAAAGGALPVQSQSFWGGAADAGANILRDQIRSDAEMERAKAIMLKQHELDLDRIRFEYRQQREAQEADLQRQINSAKASRESSNREINRAHPGWLADVKTAQFNGWLEKQPLSIKRLAASDRADDAILLLDLYKRDRR